SMLYFYGAYWLFNTTATPVWIRIVSGLIFSINNIACLFTLLRWPYGKLYSLVSFVTLGILIIVMLLNPKRIACRPILYRCFIFIILLSALFAYRSFSA